ncbi:MAG: hypothetical protein U0T32_06790 [Chitinophagales bacterium]|jgi:hypothetical protein
MQTIDLVFKTLQYFPFSLVPYYLVKGNRDFFKIIDELQLKLPPKYKKAKVLNGSLIPYFQTINLTNVHYNLSDIEIDLIHKRLETFNYKTIIFNRKKIETFSKNIQRHLSNGKTKESKLSMIQMLLEDESFIKMIPYLFGYCVGKFLKF